MLKFDGSDLITETLLQRLLAAAGLPLGPFPADMDRVLGRIFASVGGLPVVVADLDAEGIETLAVALLREAVEHVLSEVPLRRPPLGFFTRDGTPETFEQIVEPLERVGINVASASELAALPAIGATMAELIIGSRTGSGPFTSIDDLITRVPGLGEGAKAALEQAVRFNSPSTEWQFARSGLDLEDAIGDLLRLVKESDPVEALRAALDWVATSCAEQPHPTTVEMRPRHRPVPPELKTVDADAVGFLSGSEYFNLVPGLISSATTNVDVCMFHIALPSEDHPTKELLKTLVAAIGKGVKVRVLLDQDRKTDPFQSLVINTPAKEFLEQNGVECRFDKAERVLHSKFVVLDSHSVVIGSHNWSAGSFFHFDDLSVFVGSLNFGVQMQQRFDSLWDAARDGR